MRADVGFQILTAVVMKSSIFCDIMTCGPLKVNWRFAGTCNRHLERRRISQARNQRGVGSKQSSARTCSSETTVDFQRTTRRYIPEDRTLHQDGQSRLPIKPPFHAMKVQKNLYITRKLIQLLRPHGVGYNKFKFSYKILEGDGRYIISRKLSVKMQDV
jgi:hypothetical protein